MVSKLISRPQICAMYEWINAFPMLDCATFTTKCGDQVLKKFYILIILVSPLYCRLDDVDKSKLIPPLQIQCPSPKSNYAL